MRRELQVEPLILCLVQPAPSGTRAYIPKITEDPNNYNRNRNNQNFQKRNNNPNNSNNPRSMNPQNNSKSAKESIDNSEKEDSFEGRTRRRRSAVTS